MAGFEQRLQVTHNTYVDQDSLCEKCWNDLKPRVPYDSDDSYSYWQDELRCECVLRERKYYTVKIKITIDSNKISPSDSLYNVKVRRYSSIGTTEPNSDTKYDDCSFSIRSTMDFGDEYLEIMNLIKKELAKQPNYHCIDNHEYFRFDAETTKGTFKALVSSEKYLDMFMKIMNLYLTAKPVTTEKKENPHVRSRQKKVRK